MARHFTSHEQASRPTPRPTPTTQGRRPEGDQAAYYQRRRSSRRRRRRTVGIVAAAVAIVAVAVVAFVLPRILGGTGSSAASTPANTTGSVSATDASSSSSASSTTPVTNAPDGRIVLSLGGDEDTYVKQGEDYIEGGCHARDVQEGNLTSSVKVSGSVDTSTVGDYVLTYSVENSEGMVATTQRTVHVVAADSMDWDTNGIPVLMYHYVYDPANPPSDLNVNYVSTTDFDAQCAWLSENGYYYPSWQELRAYVEGTHSLPAKSVILTFDDDEHGFLDNGIPILEKYKVHATSFLICIDGDIEDKLNQSSPYVLFESHSYDLHRAGSTKLGHGGRIYDLSEQELVADIQKSADIIGSVEAFAYPYGDVSDVSSAAMNDLGISCAVTTNYGNACVGDDPTQLSRCRVSGGNSLASYISMVEN